MADQPKKYKVTDKEGAKIFLDSIRVEKRVRISKEDELRRARKKRIIRNIVIAGVVFIALVAGLSYFMYNMVQSHRNKELALHRLIDRASDFESSMRNHIESISTFESAMNTADSLITDISLMMNRYPDEDTLKYLWTTVVLHKYEKYVHYSIKSHLFEDIARLDSSDIRRIREYRPQFLHVYETITLIPEFFHYKKKYPQPPHLASIAPPQWQITRLLNNAEKMDKSIMNNSILFEVHFPVLYNWINYLNNYIVPDLNIWDDFWDDYKSAIKNHDSFAGGDGIFDELRSTFPQLEILRTGSSMGLYSVTHFSIGIAEEAIVPPGSTVEQEWHPIIRHLKNEYGFDVTVKTFNTYNELLTAVVSGSVDLALLDIPTSAFAYFSRTGTPLATRAWNGKTYLKNLLMAVDPKIDHWRAMKGGTLAYFDSDLFNLYEFYENHRVNIDSLNMESVGATSLDELIDGINRGEFDAVTLTEEELYYLRHSGRLKKELQNLAEIDPAPMDIIWARDGLPAGFVQKIQSIMISVAPQTVYADAQASLNRPYADWDKYDENVMLKYFNDIRRISLKYNMLYNRLHLIPVAAQSDTTSRKITNALTRYLEKEGFAVVKEESRSKMDKIEDIDQLISLEVNSEEPGYDKYTVRVHRKDDGGKKLVYHDQFRLENDKEPDFRHQLFDLPGHLKIVGTVRKTDSSRIVLSSTVNSHLLTGRVIELYPKEFINDESVRPYGSGRVTAVGPSGIIVSAPREIIKRIRRGDIGLMPANETK